MTKLDDAYTALNIATKDYLYHLSIREGDARSPDTPQMIRARRNFDKAWDDLTAIHPMKKDRPYK